MKEIVIKKIFSIDLQGSYGEPILPADPINFWVRVWADIGLKDGKGANEFVFDAVTPKKIAEIIQSKKFLIGRHLIIVDHFDWNLIEAAIKSIFPLCQGDNWEEISQKLARYGYWEFEDYNEGR